MQGPGPRHAMQGGSAAHCAGARGAPHVLPSCHPPEQRDHERCHHGMIMQRCVATRAKSCMLQEQEPSACTACTAVGLSMR